jgi:hypothetical protein
LEKSARFCPQNPYLKIFQKIQIALFTPFWAEKGNILQIYRKGEDN